jgi:hypothetical protein
MLTTPQAQQMGMTSTAPMPVKPLAPGAFSQEGGYNGAVGNSMQPLMQALMKAKLQQKLQGKYPGTVPQLPGTTPQSLGMGTAGADAATGPQSAPLSLGGPPPVATA